MSDENQQQEEVVETGTAPEANENPVELEQAEEVTTATPVEDGDIAPEGTDGAEGGPDASDEGPDLVSSLRADGNIDPEVPDGVVVEYANADEANPASWSTELLLTILKGQIRYPESKLGDLVYVYRQRADVPAAWDDKAVVVFLRSGTEPKKTSNGVWVADVTRANRLATDWSTAELEAWAKGEIQSGGKTHDNGVALELKARLSLKSEDSPKAVRKAYRALAGSGKVGLAGAEASKPVHVEASDEETLQLQQAKSIVAKIENVEGLTTMNVAFIDDGLKKYIDAVVPNRPINDAAALKAQKDLDRTIQYIVKLEGQALVAGMERLKVIFKKEMEPKGVFSANNVFRFTHLMRSDNKDQQRHVGILEVMRVYFSDAKEARKQVDLRTLLQYQPADRVDQLVAYFNQVA